MGHKFRLSYMLHYDSNLMIQKIQWYSVQGFMQTNKDQLENNNTDLQDSRAEQIKPISSSFVKQLLLASWTQ